MAVLQHAGTGRSIALESEMCVGRSRSCQLQIEADVVSSRHAALRWTGSGWVLKDLASKNGTFVDGSRLHSGEMRNLKVGTEMVFGHGDQRWRLVDDSGPRPMALRIGGTSEGPPAVFEENHMIVVPSPERPEVTLFADSDGIWSIEGDDDTRTIHDGHEFVAGGEVYRFCKPAAILRTKEISTAQLEEESRGPAVSDVIVEFGVSPDEEHVEVTAQLGGVRQRLGSHVHFYLLLHLARERLRDHTSPTASASEGWCYIEDLCRGLQLDSDERVNVHVCRIRKSFAALGLKNSAQVIERRPRARHIRIGLQASQIVVRTI